VAHGFPQRWLGSRHDPGIILGLRRAWLPGKVRLLPIASPARALLELGEYERSGGRSF
jgi:hypothetical protein